jgi:hypothetical protein
LLVIIALLVGATRIAQAHDVHGEVMLLDIGQHSLTVDVHVPVLQLSAVRGVEVPRDPVAMVRTDQTALRAFGEKYLGATARDGRAFSTRVTNVDVARDQGDLVVVFHAQLAAPDGATARWAELHDNMLLHVLTNANIYVFVRTDLPNGQLGAPTLLDMMHYQQRTLVVDRTGGSWARGLDTVLGRLFAALAAALRVVG